jgi:hypothetical protein
MELINNLVYPLCAIFSTIFLFYIGVMLEKIVNKK